MSSQRTTHDMAFFVRVCYFVGPSYLADSHRMMAALRARRGRLLDGDPLPTLRRHDEMQCEMDIKIIENTLRH